MLIKRILFILVQWKRMKLERHFRREGQMENGLISKKWTMSNGKESLTQLAAWPVTRMPTIGYFCLKKKYLCRRRRREGKEWKYEGKEGKGERSVPGR